MKNIIEIKNLSIDYPIYVGTVKAVRNVSMKIKKGEVIGLVGESGCGKSTLGLSLLNMVRAPGKIINGEILYNNTNILDIPYKELLKLRGHNISMIFQNPLNSLNPLYKVSEQFVETIQSHKPKIKKKKALEMAEEMFEKLGIEKSRLYEYPHQMSGGMRQRIMIGIALILNPDLIIADEPTTSLDVIVEAQFVDFLRNLKDKFDVSIMVITHNLGLVAELADRIAVMYGGKIIERGEVEKIYHNPMHEYTKGLISCIPNVKAEQKKLVTMPGAPPDLINPPSGCRFSPRCPKAMDICYEKLPELKTYDGHEVACWLYETEKENS
ncbi:MAG: ABC transporter ATP-binding protein [Candidatus Mcinerneyibacterium aminivorans]|uniref:ABC transporter ATP-binding protein n=1 Tax=Candidatus Mcinerneyibacterium aminivorans TaxID=2703815 RepID=A0A5D0MIQ3_9BACT|nr:MAG: ABC transporter ATP-binding protein [Candidatus Mcinerneyibacterium aminivorans]